MFDWANQIFQFSSGLSLRLWDSTCWRWSPWALQTEETRRCLQPYRSTQIICTHELAGWESCHLLTPGMWNLLSYLWNVFRASVSSDDVVPRKFNLSSSRNFVIHNLSSEPNEISLNCSSLFPHWMRAWLLVSISCLLSYASSVLASEVLEIICYTGTYIVAVLVTTLSQFHELCQWLRITWHWMGKNFEYWSSSKTTRFYFIHAIDYEDCNQITARISTGSA